MKCYKMTFYGDIPTYAVHQICESIQNAISESERIKELLGFESFEIKEVDMNTGIQAMWKEL